MKVYVSDFMNALLVFESEFIGMMKNGFQKFIVGSVLAARKPQIEAMISPFSVDGVIDTEVLKGVIDEGMKHCGGEFEIPVNFGVLGALGANPVNVRVTKADVDKFFNVTVPSMCNAIVS